MKVNAIALDKEDVNALRVVLGMADATALDAYAPCKVDGDLASWEAAVQKVDFDVITKVLRFQRDHGTIFLMEKDGDLAILQSVPASATQWALKSAVLTALTKVLVYIVDPLSMQNIDLTKQLVLAKLLGATSIGLLPADSRAPLDPTQMTNTDFVIGLEDTTTLQRLLRTLT